MRRVIIVVVSLLLCTVGDSWADPLTVTCPDWQTIPCNQLDNLEIAGRAVAAGGCGPASLMYRDSTLATDSLVIRIWTAEDTCGDAAVCFQSFALMRSAMRLAVLPLENLSSAEEGPRVLQRLLEDALGNASDYSLVSPAKVEDAIMRGRIRQPVLMDDEQRARLAQTTDAQYFLVGSLLNYEVYQDQYSGPIPMVSCALQLQRASDGRTVWSESLHLVGNDGEWLFALGVEHDITRLGRELARKVAEKIAENLAKQRCGTSRW